MDEPEVIERRLLSSIQDAEDIRLCTEFTITGDSFVVADPNHGDVFEYILAYARENDGQVPTALDLQSLHDFKVQEPGDVKSYAVKVRQAEIRRKAQTILYDHAESLDEDPSAAVKSIAGEMSALRLDTARRWGYADRDAMDRLTAFDKAKETVAAGGTLGIPTGLKIFDAQALGFEPGEVIIIIGSTGVGKSWFLMKFLAEAYNNQKKVMLISPEMTQAEQDLRFDVTLGHIRDVDFSHTGLRTGREDREKYSNWLNSLTNRSDWLVIDSADSTREMTFEDVWDLAVEHQPDVIAVDGLYLLGERRRGKDRAGWEMIKDGIEMLKALAMQLGSVVIATHQPNRDAMKKENRAPGLHQVGYGASVAQTGDRILSLARVAGQPTRRIMTVPKMRGGAEIIRPIRLIWEVDHGIMDQAAAEPGEFGEEETKAEDTTEDTTEGTPNVAF